MCSSRESIAVVVEEVGCCLEDVASAVIVVVEVVDPKVMGGRPEGTENVKSIACLLCIVGRGGRRAVRCACVCLLLKCVDKIACTNAWAWVLCVKKRKEREKQKSESHPAEREKKKKMKMKIGGHRGLPKTRNLNHCTCLSLSRVQKR